MYSAGDVTVVIPVYCTKDKHVVWFEECLKSVTSQDCDIVIVEDASPKSVRSVVIDNWQEGMHYFRLPENQGVSAARNRAVEFAETPLILPLDSDDTLHTGAIRSLLENFTGVPLYPDVAKFGLENVTHYRLLEFSCRLLYEKVGVSSVNVLHAKKQWESVGGWDEGILFYEDGEYNARLMLRHCGRRYPMPLVNYRIHGSQRTKTNSNIAAHQARKILAKIREYDSMCCGREKRKSAAQNGSAPAMRAAAGRRKELEMSIQSLPGTNDGRVLVQYTGNKGAGKHYYRGPVTKFPYKVVFGEMYYVDPADARDISDTMSSSRFVLIKTADPTPPVTKVVAQEVSPRDPRKSPTKEPVVVEELADPLPDIRNMKWLAEIRHMNFGPDEAKKLYDIEESGKARKKVLAHLRKYM